MILTSWCSWPCPLSFTESQVSWGVSGGNTKPWEQTRINMRATRSTRMYYSKVILFNIASRLVTADLPSSSAWLQSPPQKSDSISTLLSLHCLLPGVLPTVLAGQRSTFFHWARWRCELAHADGSSLTWLTLLQMWNEAGSPPRLTLPSSET